VGKKTGYALKVGLRVIVCVGEHIEEREAGKTEEVVFRQLKAIASHVTEWTNVVIAYEPGMRCGLKPDLALVLCKFGYPHYYCYLICSVGNWHWQDCNP
jgi:hypothetical protein